ncbi:MAG TPA: DMT family transporter [Bryobacteraceae bacterium]|nr:DMT family transporter [Bryobacteraceae bacterium]
MSTAAAVAPVTPKSPKRWQADIALAGVALIWGSTFIVVKQALGDISTIYFLTLRFWLASVFMLAMFARAFRRAGLPAFFGGLRGGMIAGLFLWSGYMLQTFGLKYTSAGNSGFLTGLYIVLVPLLSAMWFRRWPRRREFLGILAATCGLALMTFPSIDVHLRMNKGDLLTLGCALAFACHLLVLGHYSQRGLLEAVALGQIVCTAALSTISLSVEPPRVTWTSGLIFALLLTSLFATAIAFALQTWGQRFTTPSRTALIFALEPVFALVVAVVVGGEKLTWAGVGGGGAILAAILIVELGK